jgi:hypothetical protein
MSAIESASTMSYTKIITGLEQLKKEELEEVIDCALMHIMIKLKINYKSFINVWRVLTSYEYWDFPEYEKLVKKDTKCLCLPQSLGSNKYIKTHNKIKLGDIVFFHHIFLEQKSVHKIVMRGIVCSIIQEGNEHQIHPCNKGKHRPHADINNKFIRVLIQEIFDNPQIIKYNYMRQTWLKLS